MRYRALFCTALLLAGSAAMAQTGSLRSFEATTALDRTSLKYVIQAVTDLDPMAKVLHSDDFRILQVRSNQISDTDLRTAIQSTGVQLRQGEADLTNYLPAPTANTPPVYVVTGDEALDLERYRGAVQNWNTAHPDQPYSVVPLHMNDR